jgi:hypothetical protein
MKSRRETIPGSGLPTGAFVALVFASVAVFLAWNGLLWRAPRETSHVARFVISYLVVVPLAAGMLAALHRFTWGHLITTTGVVWSIKLIITSILYQALARGTATNLRAVAPPDAAMRGVITRPNVDYQSAGAGGYAAGVLRGHVRAGGAPIAGAVVFLETPARGAPAPARQTVDLGNQGARYAEPLYVVHTEDALRLVNRDGMLHTAHFTGAVRLPPTRPLLSGSGPLSVSLPEPGVVHVRCDNHPNEGTWIVAVDHPYATLTAADGSFALEGVPAGEARVATVAVAASSAKKALATTRVRVGEATELDIDVSEAREIAP